MAKKKLKEDKPIADSDIIVKNVNKKQLARLFSMFCVHKAEHNVPFAKVCEDCDACVLCEIAYKEKNLCYAIWRGGVLNA